MENAKQTAKLNEKPVVGFPQFNTQEVAVHDSSTNSSLVNVFTGIGDIQKLTEVRERAVYDIDALSFNPIASSATGVLFPDAVATKTTVESSLRVRPTNFKGPKQLDVDTDNADHFFERQIHPLASRASIGSGAWVNPSKDNLPFEGYPNPNLFYFYTDAIPTQNVQNLTHSQLTEAIRASSVGHFDSDKYVDALGSLMKSDAVPYGPAVANKQTIVQSDGGGINADPRILQKIAEEYEVDFAMAQRVRVADATFDPRFGESSPGTAYMAEQQAFNTAQEVQFDRVAQWSGIPTGYSTSRRIAS